MVTRFLAMVLAASLAMLVAGCGGSGSDPTNVPGHLANVTTEQRKQAATTASSAAGMAARPVSSNDDSFGGITQSSSSSDSVTVSTVNGDNGLEYTVVNGTTWKVASTDADKSSDIPSYNFSGKELTKKVGGGTVYVDVYSVYNRKSEDENRDTDYLAGGVWLYVPEGSGTYSYGAFVSGNDPFDADSSPNVVGKARYSGSRGSATGAYLNNEGKIGYLDGSVSLTANFDSGNPEDPQGISGEITGIRMDGDPAKTGSKLVLGHAAFGSSLGDLFKGTVTGTVDGDEYTGNWGGQFFGIREFGKDTTDTSDDKTFPGSVAGTFGATSDTGPTFLGIFGTTGFADITPTPQPGDS